MPRKIIKQQRVANSTIREKSHGELAIEDRYGARGVLVVAVQCLLRQTHMLHFNRAQ